MRIVYLSNAIIPSRQANSIHVMKMCSAFAANGHEVTLIYPEFFRLEEEGIKDVFSFYGVEKKFRLLKINSCFLPSSFSYKLSHVSLFFYLLLAVKKIIYPLCASLKAASLNPELVYSRYLPGCFWIFDKKVQIVFENHNFAAEFPWFSSILFNLLIKRKSFKKLVVISKPLYEDYKRRLKSNGDKILIAPDGADTVVNVSPAKLRGEYEFNAGYAGHLYSGRGVEIIARIAKKLPDMGFHLLGGSEKDVKFWEKSTELDNLFFYGFIPPVEVKNYLVSINVLLAPYQKKVGTSAGINTADRMSPLKIFEYMAAGKPIIASDLPVLHEILENERNSLLCPSDAADKWINAIMQLKENPELAKKIGAAAKDDFLKNYTWKTRAGKVISFK